MSHPASSSVKALSVVADSTNPWYTYGVCPNELTPWKSTGTIYYGTDWSGRCASTSNPRHYEEGYPPGFRNHASYWRYSCASRTYFFNEVWHLKWGNYCFRYRYCPGVFPAWRWTHNLGGPPGANGGDYREQLLNECRNKALLKLKDRSMNLAETAGEWRETYIMVNKRIHDLIDIAKDLRAFVKGRGWSRFRELWRGRNRPSISDIPNLWLEYRYGWTPLLNDIFSLSSALEKLNGGPINGNYDRMWMYVVRVRDHWTEYHDTVTKKVWGNTLASDIAGISRTRVRARYDYRVQTTRYLSLVDLGVTDPLYLAWALMPWSFVIDWLVNVSDFLEGWTAQAGLVYLDGSISTTTTFSETGKKWRHISSDANCDVLSQPRPSEAPYRGAWGRYFRRDRESTPPLPSLVVNPEFIRDLVGFRLFDAIALLDSVLGAGRARHYRR